VTHLLGLKDEVRHLLLLVFRSTGIFLSVTVSRSLTLGGVSHLLGLEDEVRHLLLLTCLEVLELQAGTRGSGCGAQRLPPKNGR